jgi:hypothetical protein
MKEKNERRLGFFVLMCLIVFVCFLIVSSFGCEASITVNSSDSEKKVAVKDVIIAGNTLSANAVADPASDMMTLTILMMVDEKPIICYRKGYRLGGEYSVILSLIEGAKLLDKPITLTGKYNDNLLFNIFDSESEKNKNKYFEISKFEALGFTIN